MLAARARRLAVMSVSIGANLTTDLRVSNTDMAQKLLIAHEGSRHMDHTGGAPCGSASS